MGKGDHRDLESVSAFPPAGAYMIESPQLRWAFIRKVYALVAMQLLATVAVAAAAAAAVYFVPAIRRFFAARTPAAVAAFVAIIVAPIIREHLAAINPLVFVHLQCLIVRVFR